MAVDTTKVPYNCNPRVEQLANLGLGMNIGGIVLESADRDNPNITRDGTKGWRPRGISETVINFVYSSESMKAKAGMVGKTLDVKQTSIDLEVDVSLIAATWAGKRLAHGWGTAVITLPTVPISTTIDDAIIVTNAGYQLGVTAVTSFAVGQEIGVMTGTTEYGIEEEYSYIASIDATAKIITLTTPIFQVPADAAVVRVIESKEVFITACADAPPQQYRLVKYNRSKQRTEIEHAPDMRLSGFTGITNSADGPTTYGFALTGVFKYDLVTDTYAVGSHKE